MTYVGTSGGYYGDASRGGAYQPINYIISQTAASDGTATFLFDAVALSNTWTLTINCAGAEDTARFTALSGGTQFGQFKGSNSWGPLQLQGGDRLQVTATGLVPGELYQMAGYGYANIVNEPQIIYPNAYADTVTSSTEQIFIEKVRKLLGGGGITTTIATIPTSPSWRNVYLIISNSGGGTGSPTLYTYSATGNVSGIVYYGTIVPYAGSTISGTTIVLIPISASVDTSVTITSYTAALISNSYDIYIGADLADTTMGVYAVGGSLPVTVSNTSSTPFFVESVSGSTTAVTNTSTTPIYVAATSIGGGFPISNYAGPLSVIGTLGTTSNAVKITGEGSVLGSTPVPITQQYGTPGLNVVTNGSVSGTYQHTNPYGGAKLSTASTTSPGPSTLLSAPASGFSNRIHLITYQYSGAASTTPVQALFTTGSPSSVFGALYYPYQTNLLAGGLLTTTAITVISSSSSSCTFTVWYDTVTTPSIS